MAGVSPQDDDASAGVKDPDNVQSPRADYICAADLDLPGYQEPQLIYLVASQPRTGSSLLCSTGVAGVPTEYFHPSRADRDGTAGLA